MRLGAFTLLGLLALASPAMSRRGWRCRRGCQRHRSRIRERQRPVLAVDGGCMNYHTIEGRFGPFASSVQRRLPRHAAQRRLPPPKGSPAVSVLVIASALNSANANQWSLPTTRRPFTTDEIAAVKTFVENGGSLLLIADHMPFSGAATDLAAAFGITFFSGFAFSHAGTPAGGHLHQYRRIAGSGHDPVRPAART